MVSTPCFGQVAHRSGEDRSRGDFPVGRVYPRSRPEWAAAAMEGLNGFIDRGYLSVRQPSRGEGTHVMYGRCYRDVAADIRIDLKFHGGRLDYVTKRPRINYLSAPECGFEYLTVSCTTISATGTETAHRYYALRAIGGSGSVISIWSL